MSSPNNPQGVRGRLRGAVLGGTDERLADLERQVAALEEGLAESRRLNERLSDVLDVVVELLVPAADRDDERLKSGLDALGRLI